MDSKQKYSLMDLFNHLAKEIMKYLNTIEITASWNKN